MPIWIFDTIKLVVTAEGCPENKHTVEPVAVGGRMADINVPNQVDVERSSQNGEARVSIKSPCMVVLHVAALVVPGLIDTSATASPFQ